MLKFFRQHLVLSFFASMLLATLLVACGEATPTISVATTAATTQVATTQAATQATTAAVTTQAATTQATTTQAATTRAATTQAATVANGPKSPRPGVLREASGNANPPTLDPAGLGAIRQILLNLFGGLVTYDADGKVIPLGAEKWAVSADGKTYTFTLRQGLKFQNGSLVTADDVVWSFKRNLDPKRKAPAAALLTDIAGATEYIAGAATELPGIKAVNSSTVEISLTQPVPYFPTKLALPIAAILDRREVENNERWWEKHTASIGPFSLKEWKKGQSILLAANPHYAYGKPAVDIEMLYVADAQARQAMYEAGEVDILWSIADADLERLRKDSELSRQLIEPKTLSYRTYGLVLNAKAYAPFGDVRVRQAVAMAIDRKTLVDKIFTTCAIPQGIVPAGTVPGYTPGLKVPDYNPEKARQLLAEAGFPGGQGLPELVIVQAGQGASADYMQYFENQLRTNLGMKIKLEVMERGKYLTELRKLTSLHAFFEGVSGDYLDPQALLSVPLYSKSSANLYGYSNPEFDRLIASADAESNQAKRYEMYGQAEQLVLSDGAWTPMCQGYSKLLVKPYVKGYKLNPLGIMPYDGIKVD